MPTPVLSRQILVAALAGLEAQHQLLIAQIAEVRQLLDGAPKRHGRPALVDGGGGDIPTPFRRKRRKVSAASRAKMAAAQKRRWAKVKKAGKG